MEKVGKTFFIVILLVLGLMILTSLEGCTPRNPATPGPDDPVSSDDPTPLPSETPAVKMVEGEDAIIEGLDVLLMESFPLQASALISGQFRNGCTSIARVEVEREGSSFVIHVITQVPDGDIACTEALVPFEVSAPLDILGLPAGEYTVRAGEVTTSFRLDVDNEPISEAECVQPEAGQASVTSDAFGYCFVVPDDFEKVAEPPAEVDVQVRGPARSQSQPPALAELIVTTDVAQAGDSLESFVSMMGVDISAGERLELDGEDAVRVKDIAGGGLGVDVVFVLHNGRIHWLTFQPVGAQETPVVLDDQARLIETVLESWRWGD